MIIDTILLIGGTGAMGSAVLQALLERTAYDVRILTRDPDSARARGLVEAGGRRVGLMRGNLDDAESLVAAMTGIEAVFCNTDFWSSGNPVREYQQGLNALNAARAANIEHFIWSSLDSAIGLTNGHVAAPHFDSKAAVEGWINLMQADEFMRKDTNGWFSRSVSVLVTTPYFQNFQFRVLPIPGKLSDGRNGLIFNIALGKGRYPLIALEDIGWFVCQMLEDRDRWAGRTLRVIGEALSGQDIASTFERMTGIPAEYRDVPLQTLRDNMPDTGHDLAGMFEFFQKFDVQDRARDVAELRRIHPQLMNFAGWLKASGWRGDPRAVQKAAVQLVV